METFDGVQAAEEGRGYERIRPVHTVNADADAVGFWQLIWAVDRARCVFPENTTSRLNVDGDAHNGPHARAARRIIENRM